MDATLRQCHGAGCHQIGQMVDVDCCWLGNTIKEGGRVLKFLILILFELLVLHELSNAC